MTHGKHQDFLKQLATLHNAAVVSSDDRVDQHRIALCRRLRDAAQRGEATAGRATAGNVRAVLVPAWGWWLAACSVTTLLVLGIFVQRAVRHPKSVELGPERGAVSAGKASASTPPLITSAPVRDPCLARATASGDRPLIDDFEDGNPLLAPVEDRVGLWALFKDTDSAATFIALPPVRRVPAANKNRYALHAVGGELRNWGAVIQVALQPACYDASAYAGIAFSAKGPGRLYVGVREVSVVPIEFGGTCKSNCYNAHQKKLDLSARWQTHTVLWSEMRQRGYGSLPLDVKRLNGLAFLIQADDTPFDVWIDDVTFVKR